MSDQFIVAISGSRGITSQEQVWQILDRELADLIIGGHERITFRLGDAAGVDMLALRWARERELARRIFFADPKGFNTWAAMTGYVDKVGGDGGALETACLVSDWDRDPQAGSIRNAAMIGSLEPAYRPLADLLVAIWDGSSRGTRNCMATARNARVPVHQYGGGQRIVFRRTDDLDDVLVQYCGELS